MFFSSCQEKGVESCKLAKMAAQYIVGLFLAPNTQNKGVES
jgi:hypothetical protein